MTENPFSEEQREELNRLAQLPPEEQQVRAQEFFQRLTPEQREFLKRQQDTQCIFCALVEGKVSARKIYEDDFLLATLDINPVNRGHVILFPKTHYELLTLIPDVGHLFNVANRISRAVFEVTKAQGTNIFVANGVAAGQKMPHVVVHIISRFTQDHVYFNWNKVEVSENDMNELARTLSSLLYIPKKEQPSYEEIIDLSSEERVRVP